MKARDATKYPALFNNYWGSFTIKENDTITPKIIENRNRFVEEFGIIQSVRYQAALDPFFSSCYERDCYEECDHKEAYKTQTGQIILVCSNYGGGLPLARFGMVPYLPLYSTVATTYIRVFANAVEMRAVMKGTGQ